MTGYEIVLDKFDLTAKGEGEDGLGQADIIANYKGRKYHGTGVSTDIVEASGQALLHVINSIHRADQIAQIKQKKKRRYGLILLKSTEVTANPE
uniref:alpha-isopropylmalate synthase regulatory domain-containing protein n=1 Tax=Vibrio cholerae TaxID=666 RepID=UPI003F5848F5